MKNNDLMTFISKAVIIIPLAILVVALMIKFNQPTNNNYSTVKIPLTPTAILYPTKIATADAKLNLNGPYICLYQDKNSSISAYIKNQQIFIKLLQEKINQNFLVRDDCYYSWSSSKTSGEKKCGGIQQIISMVNTLLGMEIFNLKSFTSYLPDKNLNISQNQLQSIFNSCKKEVINDNLFNLPKGVIFSQKAN